MTWERASSLPKVGLEDGTRLGIRLGVGVGLRVGFEVGAAVGSRENDGADVGTFEGKEDGCCVGAMDIVGTNEYVGWSDGSIVGTPVGEAVGPNEGRTEGPSVGTFDGCIVGAAVGAAVGAIDGPDVGEIVVRLRVWLRSLPTMRGRHTESVGLKVRSTKGSGGPNQFGGDPCGELGRRLKNGYPHRFLWSTSTRSLVPVFRRRTDMALTVTSCGV